MAESTEPPLRGDLIEKVPTREVLGHLLDGPPPRSDQTSTEPAPCKHYADLYGRCVDCGKTWEQRKTESEVQE